MHSIHSLPTPHSEQHQLDTQMQMQHNQQATAQQQPPPQQAQLQHQQQQTQNNPNDNSQPEASNTMTVLESLDPTQQQVMSLIDPNVVQQHLVQQPSGHPQQQQQQPLLHQLQPSHAVSATASMDSTSSQLAGGVEQQAAAEQQQTLINKQQQQNATRPSPASSNTNGSSLARQRQPIEGIVADGGGPIVQWLLDNYEIADGESLPRSTVYNHYLAHCRSLQMVSVNAASFGKLIRSVFIGLKTRRLGTRGHSKYHYFGVRAKPHIQQELLQHQEGPVCSSSRDFSNNENSNQNTDNGSESDSTGNGLECGRLSTGSSGKRVKRSSVAPTALSSSRRNQMMYHQDPQLAQQLQDSQQQQQQPDQHLQHHLQQHHQQQQQHHHHHQAQQQQHVVDLQDSNGLYYASSVLPTTGAQTNNSNNGTNGYDKNGPVEHIISIEQNHCELADFRNHLGANWGLLVDEHWPQRELGLFELQLSKQTGLGELAGALELFESRYKSYYKRMVELLSELKFLEIEQLWQEFWHPIDEQLANKQANSWPPEMQQQSHQQHQVSTNGTDQDHQQRQQQQQVSLTFGLMYQLTSQPMIIERITEIDCNLYNAIESFLLPDVLSPIPRPLAKQILFFAENICLWIGSAVRDYEQQFVAKKTKSALAFGIALRRYTRLNYLSTCSRAIWEKRSSLAQMSMDLSRVDLRDIEHQVSLMSNSSDETANLLNSGVDLPQSAIGTNRNNANDTTNSGGGDNNELGTNTATAVNSNQAGGRSGNIGVGSLGAGTAPVAAADNNENNLFDHHHQNHGHNTHQHQQQHHNQHHPHQLCAMQPGQLIQNFLHLLEDPYPANSWPDWCRNLVESRVCGLSQEEAGNFVLKWNFYISLIMKELTLRAAPSLTSFQLIKLLFDEYITYLVLTRLAQAQRKTIVELVIGLLR